MADQNRTLDKHVRIAAITGNKIVPEINLEKINKAKVQILRMRISPKNRSSVEWRAVFHPSKNKKKMKEHQKKRVKNNYKKITAKQSLEEIFNNFYYKILYSYPFIGDYYINTML